MRSRPYVCASAACVLFCIASLLSVEAWSSSSAGASEGAQPQARIEQIVIPGPLKPFLRMAGISQKVPREDVLALVARNIYVNGYESVEGRGRPAEFLILLDRYLQQARELQKLAVDGTIRVASCEDAKPLLKVLGYRPQGGACGNGGAALETANRERAFVTVDSGFPLSDLEEALHKGKPFAYPFPESPVPILYTEGEWVHAARGGMKPGATLIDALIRDHTLARVYWGISRIEPETRTALLQLIGLRKLRPHAAVLDFGGEQLWIRSGRVIVPGGAEAEPYWKELVGVSPDSPREFLWMLLTRDRGWLAAYYDALSRVPLHQQVRLTSKGRLRRNYNALRSSGYDATRGMFRPAAGLLMLVNQLQWSETGDPLVPGDLDTWKKFLSNQKSGSREARRWNKRTRGWTSPEQLMEAMFAFSPIQSDSGPLQVYLSLCALDSRRSKEQRLAPRTVELMASRFMEFGDQYLIFSEFPDLDDASIARFLTVAEEVDAIADVPLRANTMGVFQANVGLWQILARQQQVAGPQLNESLQKVIAPFEAIASDLALVDAGRTSLGEVLRAATGEPLISQSRLVDLLAGPQQQDAEAGEMHQEVANGIRFVLESQRLVSLDTLMSLDQGLREASEGRRDPTTLVPLARELQAFEMPRPIFSGRERAQWAAGTYNNRHAESQLRTDLVKQLKPATPTADLKEARAKLVPFLRDTLVGLNYAYYEPPGSQLLLHNPLFVRSHDFAGESISGLPSMWQTPRLFGRGSPAGGGAHLVGSLANLPHVLAEVEQDFIVPESLQALIWKDLVPTLLANAIIPRWWGVSPDRLRAVALYQQAGEELLKASARDEDLRLKVMQVLSDRMAPQRVATVRSALEEGRAGDILPHMMPVETFYLADEYRRRFPSEIGAAGAAGQELERLSQQSPGETGAARLSQEFGVPHPVLARSYRREILNVQPFPTFGGYSSRLLAESWDSSNLYWARLADEMGYTPEKLNRLVPDLTLRMVEKISATQLEDWPAVLRAMRETGEELRRGKLARGPDLKSAAR